MEMEILSSFPIYFDDLTEDCQKRLLEAYGVETSEDADLDLGPVAEHMYHGIKFNDDDQVIG